MQNIEEFMGELFSARLAEEKRILENRIAYRQKFFSPDCFWDSRKGTLGMIESERVVSTEVLGVNANVITEYNIPFYGPNVRFDRRRYQLKQAGEHWLIYMVEQQCPNCHGEGGEECFRCKGHHWLGPPKTGA